MTSPIAVAETIDTETTREIAAMSPLFKRRTPQRRPQLADVTIVSSDACGISELRIGIHR
jgi:hypothetical protein